jgi:predicted TIM-barrel fold metal-dependent hydrolase
MPNDAVAQVAAKGFRPTGGYKISVVWSPEAALAYMDRQGIAAQVVSFPMAFAGTADDPQFGTRLCRMIKEGNAELIAKYPGRFGAFASLPADGPDEALAELAYAVDELDLDGVVLTSNVGGRYFGDPLLEPVLAELEHRQVPVFVHSVDSPCIEVLGFGWPTGASGLLSSLQGRVGLRGRAVTRVTPMIIQIGPHRRDRCEFAS